MTHNATTNHAADTSQTGSSLAPRVFTIALAVILAGSLTSGVGSPAVSPVDASIAAVQPTLASLSVPTASAASFGAVLGVTTLSASAGGSLVFAPATPTALPVCLNASGPITADVVTVHAGYGDWARTLVDTQLRLPSSYAPRDLVSVAQAKLPGGGLVRSLAISDLTALAKAAKEAGAPLRVVSAYRSYSNQVSTFAGWVRAGGYASAVRTSARPGHSEHQLGTAIDFGSLGGGDPWNYTDWGTTKAGAWMGANAWRYGFVLSYPNGASDRVCYNYEAWHYRYFGRAIAAAIHASGLATREWLWARQ